VTLDEVIALLQRHQQRASYGAVAGVVDGRARGLMTGRPKCPGDSWVVAGRTSAKLDARKGYPTGYTDDEIDGACLAQIRSHPDRFIRDPSELRKWIGDHTQG
jgi:hypothetical protein